jgi:hypothetical protein
VSCLSPRVLVRRDTTHIVVRFLLTRSDIWCIFCHDLSRQSLETRTISAKKSLINFPIGRRIKSHFAKHQKVVLNTRRETALHIYQPKAADFRANATTRYDYIEAAKAKSESPESPAHGL